MQFAVRLLIMDEKIIFCFISIHRLFTMTGLFKSPSARGFYGSVNIPESYNFRSQFLLLNIIFQPSFLNTFFAGISVVNKKYKTNKSVTLKIVKI